MALSKEISLWVLLLYFHASFGPTKYLSHALVTAHIYNYTMSLEGDPPSSENTWNQRKYFRFCPFVDFAIFACAS
jgi:hypothetical protein